MRKVCGVLSRCAAPVHKLAAIPHGARNVNGDLSTVAFPPLCRGMAGLISRFFNAMENARWHDLLLAQTEQSLLMFLCMHKNKPSREIKMDERTRDGACKPCDAMAMVATSRVRLAAVPQDGARTVCGALSMLRPRATFAAVPQDGARKACGVLTMLRRRARFTAAP